LCQVKDIHPGWLSQICEKLEISENGLFVLKKKYRLEESKKLDNLLHIREVYFILTTEISNIYKKNGKVRKVHNVVVFPNLESVNYVQSRVAKIGNINSDGRPTLGMDSKNLLEIVLHSSDYAFIIPAHIWTPWFSVLGSRSGFDSIDECFEDLTQYIFAVETGLSSDPEMNWRCSFLDKFKLVSNSDAHSAEKLGREANIFSCEIGYQPIFNSLKGDKGFEGTIEFFPQEGKYFLDGHRNCKIMWEPSETIKNNGICQVCGKPVTKGVLYRVNELADRKEIINFKNKRPFVSITQLSDLIALTLGLKSTKSKLVQKKYYSLINNVGTEFDILLNSDLELISRYGSEKLTEAVKKLRLGDVNITPGYDGEFGKLSFEKNDAEQLSLF